MKKSYYSFLSSFTVILLILFSIGTLQVMAAGSEQSTSKQENSSTTGTATSKQENTSAAGTSKSENSSTGDSTTSKNENSSSVVNKHTHSGGIATCSKLAVCTSCGQEYGELDPDNHSLVDHEPQIPSCTSIGWNAYQTCLYCDYTTYTELSKLEHELIAKSDEKTHYYECTVCHYKFERAPHSGGIATPTKQAICEVCGNAYGALDGEHLVVAIPAANTKLIYNGTEQIGVPEGEGYTLTNHVQTNAGTYKATAVLDPGNEWLDGTVSVLTIEYTIQRAGVAAHAKNCTKTYGDSDPAEFEVEYRGLIGDDQIEYQIQREEGEETGTYRINLSGERNQANYYVDFAPGILTIKPYEVTASVTVPDKWFDGSVNADISVEIKGVNGDTVTIGNVTGQFDDSQVGKNKTVTIDSSKAEILVNGAADKLKNYTITIPDTVVGRIQGPFVGKKAETPENSGENAAEVSHSDSSSEESANESSSNESSVTESAETSGTDSSQDSSSETSGNESSNGAAGVDISSDQSLEESAGEPSSEDAASGNATSEQSMEESSENALAQLTSGDNWTIIWFIVLSLLGCFVAGTFLAWKADEKGNN